jgi:hypothetical protein
MMQNLRKLLTKIPSALSSMPSIFIFIFLFVYLFVLGAIGLVYKSIEPSANVQLVFGNYTNVLSALGAALAAGAGSTHAKHLKDLNRKHDELRASVDDLHAKLDKLAK